MLLLSLPFCLYAVFILMVDPFDFFNGHAAVPEGIKLRTAAMLNPCFWKMNQYKRRPAANILLGDSQMVTLRADKIKEITGEDYFNFASGGGSIKEDIDTFWFAARLVKLRKVYIDMSLTSFNDAAYSDRTKLFLATEQNPVRYFLSQTVARAAVYAAYSALTHTDLKLGVPRIPEKAFWQNELLRQTDIYRRRVYPTKYKPELAHVIRYCREQGIQVFFVILPAHVDLQYVAKARHLEKENELMRRDLRAMAPLYDFNFENEITVRKENFKDPTHFSEPIADLIIREIWGGQLHHGKVYDLPPVVVPAP